MSSRYKFHNSHSLYFSTDTVVGWIDIFSRKDYIDILYKSWKYCIQEKGLSIHAYVVMSNHVHMIISSKENDLSSIVRDWKKFTAKRIIEAVNTNPKESRKKWMLNYFQECGNQNRKNECFQFWQNESHPIALWSPKIIQQKITYIHQNPVKAGIVSESYHYLHSSASVYTGKKGFLPIYPIFI